MKVSVIGPITSAGGISRVISAVTESPTFQRGVERLNRIHTCEYKDKGPLGEMWALFTGLCHHLAVLATGETDIVHIHSSGYISFYRKLLFFFPAWAWRKRVIFHLHSSHFDDFFLSGGRVRRGLIRWVLRRCDRVVVLCRDWQRKLAQAYQIQNLEVIANPACSVADGGGREASTRAGGSELTVLFMGFLIRSKGIFDLLETAARCRDSGLRFVVCGKGEEEKAFLREVADRALAESIDFQGWLAGQERLTAYREADVLFLPSYKEGMPMVILEAIGFGLPVVSTRIAGIPDVIRDGREGFLLEPGDVDGFAARLKQLASAPDLRVRMGRNAQVRAAAFDRETIAERWLELYRSLHRAASFAVGTKRADG
jgi:glycosyltransferase involved in cell wall biosynthesis